MLLFNYLHADAILILNSLKHLWIFFSIYFPPFLGNNSFIQNAIDNNMKISMSHINWNFMFPIPLTYFSILLEKVIMIAIFMIPLLLIVVHKIIFESNI